MEANPTLGAGTVPAQAAGAEALPRDRLLVVVGSSGEDLDLIRTGQRLAADLHAPWTVIDVPVTAFPFIFARGRERHSELLRLAECLGAESVTLQGGATAAAIAAYARLHGSTRIVLGAPARLGWTGLLQYARIAALKRQLPELPILAVAQRPQQAAEIDPAAPPAASASPRESTIRPSSTSFAVTRRYLSALVVTALCTGIAFPLSGRVDLINIVMLYMLGAAVAGLFLGRGPSAVTAACNILAFDYFFVPPRFSFIVLDSSYLVTFAAMLLVALIIANLMIVVREQTDAAGAREQRTAALYAITRDLAVVPDAETMVATTARRIEEVLQAHARVLLCDEDGNIVAGRDTQAERAPAVNPAAAHWVVARSERAGVGTANFTSEPARYLPLRASRATIGVLVAEPSRPGESFLPEQQRLLEAVADQLALALERARLADVAHAAHLSAERVALRNTLLTSISHDLRTPLSAIAGAGSIVAQNDFALDIYRRVTLGRLIEDKARDMTDLLTNVLELVRLESGADVLRKDWNSVSDLVGMAIQRNESRLTGWDVTTDLPADLPLVSVDATLIVQMLSNLLENAVKYTPPGTRIRVSAQRVDATLVLVVEDSGPGLGADVADRLFEKFTRGRIESNIGGVGLGLAICRAVSRLHGGDIRASRGPLGGARFEITLRDVIEDPAAADLPSPIA